MLFETIFPVIRELEHITEVRDDGKGLATYFLALLELVVLLKMRPDAEITEKINSRNARIEATKLQRLQP